MAKRKRRNLYGPDTRAEIKRLFVQEGWTPFRIAVKYDKHPAHNTINNWAKKKNKAGINWFDEREQYENQVYENLSPQGLAEKILQRIYFLLQKDVTQFDHKEADALAKLQKSMERMVDKRFQIPMLYELLTRFVEFLKANYKELVSKEMINAVRHFKNEIKNEIELGNVAKVI